jgi:hypothetical protein
MTNFHIEIDNKFDNLIFNIKQKKEITINDLIELKTFIFDIYYTNNNINNEYIKKSLSMIDLKI